MRARSLAFAFAWVLLISCSSVPARAQPLKVVATLAPLADWTRRVGADRVMVDVIVPVGVDPQLYEPSEQQRQQIKAADVIFLNGLGVEPWIDELLQQSRSGQIVVELSQFIAPPAEPDRIPTPTAPAGIVPQTTPTVERAPRARPSQEPSRYLWLSPQSAIGQVDMIARALTRADAAGFPVYRQNAARYVGDIENLDARIEREVVAWPQQVVQSTDLFLYPFTQRFGLTLQILDAPATSSTAPVFVDRFLAPRNPEMVLPADAVVLNPLGKATYSELMETLVVSMTDALAHHERGPIE